MCQAIDDMRKESREEGRMEGRLEGRTEGIESTCLKNIRNLMITLKCTAQQAMDYLMIPAADQSKYLAKL